MSSVFSLEGLLKLNDEVLSRTASSGSANTSVSIIKSPLLVSGRALQDSISANRAAVAHYIEQSTRSVALTTPDLISGILCIASLTTAGTLPSTLFRAWDLPSDRQYGPPEDSIEVPPNEIWSRLQEVAARAVDEMTIDPVAAAAGLEWDIGIGPLHPFYDACGRSSRGISALLLHTSKEVIRVHRSRDDYFSSGRQGRRSFIDYVKSI